MWKQEKNDGVIVHLALSLALATTPLAANLLVSVPVLAELKSEVFTFPPPQTVERGTKVRIDGSMSLVMINQSLKDSFEKQFAGTQVEIGVNGTDAALKALLDGEIDIAAIARVLTPEEKSQGLEQVRLGREKIAIIVGANNPFQGSLTGEQFAKIFRGEITDWSELGGSSGKIRLIDRPPTSDTRNSFRDYPLFKSAEFSTGANATQVAEDKTAQIIKKLGTDGISYVIANQVSKLADVRIIKIQGITPDNSKYPFSQPLVYVYKQNPSPAVASFLGFTTAPVGQKAIEAARDAEASAIAASALQSFTPETKPVTTAASSDTPVVATAVQSETLPTANSSGNQQFVNPFEERNTAFLTVLSLLPIVGLGGFLAWWLKRKQQSADEKIAPLETSTASASIPETILTIPDQYSITPPVKSSTLTNGTSHSNQNATSTISNSEKNLTLTETETSPGSLKSVTAKSTNTATEVANYLDIATQTISLDCGEVVWDTEAPVAVVNTPYPSVPNIPEIAFNNNLELPTDELTTSLSELLDEPAESSAQNSTTFLSELLDEPAESSAQNSTTSLSELLDEPAESSAQNSTTSLSELLDDLAESSTQNSTTSLSELLDDLAESSTQNSTTSLSELLDNLAESSAQNSTTSLSELLDEPVESSAQNSTAFLSELLDEPVESSAQNSTAFLSELLDELVESSAQNSTTFLSELLGVLVTSADAESNTSLLKSPTVSTANSHQESMTSLSELLGLTPEEEGLDVEVVTDEGKNSLTDLSNEPEEIFNTLADEAELTADLAEELSLNLPIPYHLPEATINHAELEIDAETENITIDSIPEDFSLKSKAQTHTTQVVSWSDMSGDSSIVFTPRTPKWAYVSWYVSETHKEAVRKIGGTTLAVRLYDATDIDLSYQIPQVVQQYECEEIICDCYIAIPTSNRDYITEIGYITNNNSWLCIARSGKVRIFNRPGTDFWFVADTELVIHGSTEPGATVTIGDHRIKLESDGTFHLRVPFSDRLFNYLMTATAADGEHSITILKKFFQESSEN
ncbi:substrate-binding domain-containing protein [Anabaena sphaerica FACHB-251]|uniref:Substrate-binding domain-containing protein n=1 Tax=Anabaena sphaerica FACHB-251 TaxID=2692883 RepID=A0A926WFG3_9NOST|nr:substrate-binding domain-containing protein [Anabaena sphaerica]MBD2293595.1 substrate-binding domain-containing protein [Anabaena sphaerica FACHB-251]